MENGTFVYFALGLLRDQIFELIMKNNGNSRTQFGFRSKISTKEDPILNTENF